jgi:hypothetical protein
MSNLLQLAIQNTAYCKLLQCCWSGWNPEASISRRAAEERQSKFETEAASKLTELVVLPVGELMDAISIIVLVPFVLSKVQ